jgi:hypothetical protein
MAEVHFTLEPDSPNAFPGSVASIAVDQADACTLDSLAGYIRFGTWGGLPYATTINYGRLWLEVNGVNNFDAPAFALAIAAACNV